MADNEAPREIPESANGYGKHDRVKHGYWPEKFGDQLVYIDLDHPQAHMVRSAAEAAAAYEAECRKRAEEHETAERERAQREAEERQLQERIDDVVSDSSTSSEVEKEETAADQPSEAPSAPPASKSSRRR